MREQSLQVQLQALHDILQNSPQLDEATHTLLIQIACDINNLDSASAPPNDLTDLLQEQVIQFENEHPAISTILRQITDTLGRIGV